nr:translation initiation factor IF-2-like isoform X17 [Anser cygnoides]XP_047908677.1 translation initiation factor IF-2-like isoform X17 [Anser cygnoides]
MRRGGEGRGRGRRWGRGQGQGRAGPLAQGRTLMLGQVPVPGQRGAGAPGRKRFLPRPCTAPRAGPGPAAHPLLSPARMEPAKPPPSKRMAPAPPVPAKTKPALGLPSKPSSPQPGTSAEMERGRAGDPGRAVAVVRAPGAAAMPCSDTVPFADTDGFSALQVTTAKLSHPTATRPRVPGRRLPSMAGVGLGPPCAELCPHLPAAGQGPEQRLALEDLKAEVRSLHILVDLMRGQHLRDLEDVRLELQHERTKREALQVRPPWPWDTRTPPTHPQCPTNPPAPFSSLQAEIERVRKALPC